MKRAVAGVLIVFFLRASAFAAGGVGCDYLRVEPAARTAAMSNAFAGVADDLSALIYNPAGLVNLESFTISITHFSSFADTNYEYVAMAYPMGKTWGTLGGSVLVDYTFDFEEYNEFGSVVGNVDNYDIVASVSYAYPVIPGFSIGATIKTFYSRLYIYSKNGFALDAGIQAKLGEDPDTYAGFSIQNIGSQGAYIDVADPLPMNIKAGLGIRFFPVEFMSVLITADVNRLFLREDELPTLDMGTECVLYDSICLRAGYGFRHDVANVSLGLGVIMEKVCFSYAFQPFDTLGATHRISLDIVLK